MSPAPKLPISRILLTGATGFLGRPLARLLSDAGHELAALARNPAAARAALPAAVKLFEWKAPAAPPPEALRGIDAVVHLAGESIGQWPWSGRRRALLWESRVTATQALAAAMNAASTAPKVLITASGMGYHGDCGIVPVTEAGPPGGDFLGLMASAWEKAALQAKAGGTRVVCLRFGMVLDRQGGALPTLARPFRYGLGARMGSGRQGQPWIHREDALGLIQAALQSDLEGPVHALAPDCPSQADFAKALGQVLRRPVLLRAPASALRILLGPFSEIVLHGQYAMPAKALAAGYRFRYPVLETALRHCLG